MRVSRRALVVGLLAAGSAQAGSSMLTRGLRGGLVPLPLTIAQGTLANTGAVGVAYDGTPAISGGTLPRTVVMLSPMPPGLAVDPLTGRLFGTPT